MTLSNTSDEIKNLSALTDDELDNEIYKQLKYPRYLALTNLYYLTTEVLDYKDLSPRIHAPLCDLIQMTNQTIIKQAGSRCLLNSYEHPYADYGSYNKNYVNSLSNCDTTGYARTDSGGTPPFPST